MAGSYIPGPLRPDPFSKLLPAETPGPLGINDAGDPNVSAQSGDTPGPLGRNDYAEPFANSAHKLGRSGNFHIPGAFQSGTALKGQQQRNIYIFVTFPPEEQMVTPFYKEGKRNVKVPIPAPPFDKLAGPRVFVKNGSEISRDALIRALGEEGATVIFVGHSAYYMQTQDQWDAIDIAMGRAESPQLFLHKGKIETIQVKAETVAIISCDSANFAGKAFSGAKHIIGLESGSGTNVGSSTHSMARAGYAIAQQLIKGKGPDEAVKAANGAIAPTATVNNEPMTWMRGDSDVGDKYVRIK
jgi:hypothetical protein